MTGTDSNNLSLDSLWEQAFAHHRAGRLQEAERLYREILKSQPNHADANHNLGVLAMQVGQYAAGLPYLYAALMSFPSRAQYSLSYAEALLATGQARDALSVLDAAQKRGVNACGGRDLRRRVEAA